MAKDVALIGYSGHALVVADILSAMGKRVCGYCEIAPKDNNPLGLSFLGDEKDEKTQTKLGKLDYFPAIGDNKKRKSVYNLLVNALYKPIIAQHPDSSVSASATVGAGVLISAGACVNTMAIIGDGVICNTGCIIEHECRVGDFSHIAPSATLLGNVEIGTLCLIGGNSVIMPGIKIGDNVVVGAGSVVLNDIPSNTTVAGNPAKMFSNKNT